MSPYLLSKCRTIVLGLVVSTLGAMTIRAEIKAIVIVTNGSGKAEIRVALTGGEVTSHPTVDVYGTDGKIEKAISPSQPTVLTTDPTSVTGITFTLEPYDPRLSYTVVLHFTDKDADGNTITRRLSIPVEPSVTAELGREPAACGDSNQLQLVITSKGPIPPAMPHVPADLVFGKVWVQRHKGNPATLGAVTVVTKASKQTSVYRVANITDIEPTGNSYGACLTLDKRLPSEEFDASLKLLDKPTPDTQLASEITGKGLTGNFSMDYLKENSAKKGSPDDWSFDRTLDVSLSLTTKVEDKNVSATNGQPATVVRKRQTDGFIDFQFKAPNVLHTIFEANKWMTFFTPFFINAAVSTGKITDDTLSQNRVVMGFGGEFRYRRFNEGHPSSFQRIKWAVQHASDRDFKQKEVYASVEYAPIFDGLYKPYDLNYKYVAGKKVQSWYGFSVEPSVGFDFGKTYSRRNPAAAIKPTPLVKRFTFGMNLGLDLTQFVSLTADEAFYLRTENPEHRMKNLFKAEGLFKIYRSPSERTVHGLFISYEKGQGPPFSTQDANSVKIGYRIIGNYWCVECQ